MHISLCTCTYDNVCTVGILAYYKTIIKSGTPDDEGHVCGAGRSAVVRETQREHVGRRGLAIECPRRPQVHLRLGLSLGPLLDAASASTSHQHVRLLSSTHAWTCTRARRQRSGRGGGGGEAEEARVFGRREKRDAHASIRARVGIARVHAHNQSRGLVLLHEQLADRFH